MSFEGTSQVEVTNIQTQLQQKAYAYKAELLCCRVPILTTAGARFADVAANSTATVKWADPETAFRKLPINASGDNNTVTLSWVLDNNKLHTTPATPKRYEKSIQIPLGKTTGERFTLEFGKVGSVSFTATTPSKEESARAQEESAVVHQQVQAEKAKQQQQQQQQQQEAAKQQKQQQEAAKQQQQGETGQQQQREAAERKRLEEEAAAAAKLKKELMDKLHAERVKFEEDMVTDRKATVEPEHQFYFDLIAEQVKLSFECWTQFDALTWEEAMAYVDFSEAEQSALYDLSLHPELRIARATTGADREAAEFRALAAQARAEAEEAEEEERRERSSVLTGTATPTASPGRSDTDTFASTTADNSPRNNDDDENIGDAVAAAASATARSPSASPSPRQRQQQPQQSNNKSNMFSKRPPPIVPPPVMRDKDDIRVILEQQARERVKVMEKAVDLQDFDELQKIVLADHKNPLMPFGSTVAAALQESPLAEQFGVAPRKYMTFAEQQAAGKVGASFGVIKAASIFMKGHRRRKQEKLEAQARIEIDLPPTPPLMTALFHLNRRNAEAVAPLASVPVNTNDNSPSPPSSSSSRHVTFEGDGKLQQEGQQQQLQLQQFQQFPPGTINSVTAYQRQHASPPHHLHHQNVDRNRHLPLVYSDNGVEYVSMTERHEARSMPKSPPKLNASLIRARQPLPTSDEFSSNDLSSYSSSAFAGVGGATRSGRMSPGRVPSPPPSSKIQWDYNGHRRVSPAARGSGGDATSAAFNNLSVPASAISNVPAAPTQQYNNNSNISPSSASSSFLGQSPAGTTTTIRKTDPLESYWSCFAPDKAQNLVGVRIPASAAARFQSTATRQIRHASPPTRVLSTPEAVPATPRNLRTTHSPRESFHRFTRDLREMNLHEDPGRAISSSASKVMTMASSPTAPLLNSSAEIMTDVQDMLASISVSRSMGPGGGGQRRTTHDW